MDYEKKYKEALSKDEKIRKELIAYLESDRDSHSCQDISFYERAITYLEKQKESFETEENKYDSAMSQIDTLIVNKDGIEGLCGITITLSKKELDKLGQISYGYGVNIYKNGNNH